MEFPGTGVLVGARSERRSLPQFSRPRARQGAHGALLRLRREARDREGAVLEREPWRGGQCCPPHLEPPRCTKMSTRMRLRNPQESSSKITEAIGEYWLSDIRMPCKSTPGAEPMRPSYAAPASVVFQTAANAGLRPKDKCHWRLQTLAPSRKVAWASDESPYLGEAPLRFSKTAGRAVKK
eukprot:TRINITY_DN17584_c0_g1_i2.p1 TRINITY_DN17584_c0_g1~~TRINITY_DN17584_c0_g1_i2.p1  ORF type:complete len:181 (+),score=9.09 TRINITY_DN17584_c0_g1_i2:185-727(+)